MLYEPSIIAMKQAWLDYIIHDCYAEVVNLGFPANFRTKLIEIFAYWFKSCREIHLAQFTVQRVRADTADEIIYYFDDKILDRGCYFSNKDGLTVYTKKHINPLCLFIFRVHEFCKLNSIAFNIFNIKNIAGTICDFISINDVDIINYILNGYVFNNLLANKKFVYTVKCR